MQIWSNVIQWKQLVATTCIFSQNIVNNIFPLSSLMWVFLYCLLVAQICDFYSSHTVVIVLIKKEKTNLLM